METLNVAIDECTDKPGSDVIVIDTLPDVRLDKGLWQTAKENRRAVLYTILACCGAMSEGYQTVIQSALMVNVGFVNHMGSVGLGAGNGKALDPVHAAAWGGAYSAAYILALLWAWWPVERFGTKMTLYAAQVCLAVACAVEILAREWGSWMASKILFGMVAGVVRIAAIHYIAEINPTRLRGALLCCYPLLVGQFCGTIAVQLMVLTSPFRYRRVLYAQYLFIAIAVGALGHLPESPRWLVTKGRNLTARISIQRLHPNDHENEKRVLCLLSEIEAVKGQTTWRYVVRGSNIRQVMISSFGLVWQKWLGSSIILGYAAYFFQLGGVLDPFTGSIVVRSIALLGAATSIYLVERIGRRRIMLCGGAILIIFVLIMGAVLSLPLASATGVGLVLICCMWVAIFEASVSPLAIVYLGESSSDHLRAKTISLAACGAAVVNLVVDYCIPLALNSQHFDLSYGAWLFSCTGTVGLVACYCYLPDYTNRSTAQLEFLGFETVREDTVSQAA